MSDTIQTLTITSETGRTEDGVWIRREAYDILTEQLKEKDKRIDELVKAIWHCSGQCTVACTRAGELEMRNPYKGELEGEK